MIVGLMTGTSLDGIDAVLAEVDGGTVDQLEWRLIRSATIEHSAERREAIHHGIASGDAATLCMLDADLGEWLAQAVHELCQRADVEIEAVDLVGSHGQTIWHVPPTEGRRGSTLQIGSAARIAERTGIPVVSDFRARDVAAGGHGAPLVPWVDRALFAAPGRVRALQNLGGIGNVSRVPPKGSGEPLLAFDTGPGNSLIDAVVGLSTDGRLTYDRDGILAARGEVEAALLDELLQHPFFSQEPPKSTGRETFGRPLVQRLVEVVEPEGDRDWLDLIATLTELTARSVADAYARWLIPLGLDEVIVTGGGALNPTLMNRIAALVDPLPVVDSSTLGIRPTEKEALAFAILAWAHVKGIPANVPEATGASGLRVLGSLTPGWSGKGGISNQ
ncbi:MAG: anhydro-N-acetylmuramic acid kinase [Gemmatimonas sp.]|nr:anhydro-N-acetylmuramic acid kinase [Gemmatimonas sp.]